MGDIGASEVLSPSVVALPRYAYCVEVRSSHQIVRAALERGVTTPGDTAEILGVSTEEIRNLRPHPGAADDERRVQQDLEDAAFANRER
ncbi:MAG: hypothetical protein ACP5PM_09730 [Acidimicrobiales bacterium]